MHFRANLADGLKIEDGFGVLAVGRVDEHGQVRGIDAGQLMQIQIGA